MMETGLSTITQLQQSYIKVAEAKEKVDKRLQAYELSLQSIKDLKEFKSKLDEMIAFRKKFTNQINELIIEPLMSYEKRSNVIYNELKASDLEHRKLQQMKEQEIQALESEKAQYKMLVVQYYTVMEKSYVSEMYNLIDWHRKNSSLEVCIDALKALKPKGNVPNFTPKYLLEIDKKQIFEAIEKPNFKMHLDNCIAEAEKVFSIETYTPPVDEITNTIEAKAAIETLSIKAETPNVITTKVKAFSKIEVTNQDEAKAVIVAFLKCFNYWDKLLKVRSWDSLCDKMAAAVAKHHDETGEIFEGINFKTVEK